MTEEPALLGKVRKDAVDALEARLVDMCDGADDALFDLSQKAPESEQSLYFDAMRELRLKREGMVHAYRSAVDAGFAALTGRKAESARAGVDTFSAAGLTLLGEDELDVSVAFQGMITRSREILATDLDHLRQRLGAVLAREIDIDAVPLQPTRICEPFRIAAEQLGLPIKARLILFKLFQRNVLEYLRDIVAAANLTLAQGGILPEIKSTRPRPLPSRGSARSRDGEKAARADGGGEGEGGGGGGGGGGLPAALAELLALARGPAGQGAALPIPVASLAPGQLPVMRGGQAMVGGAVVQSDVPLQVVAPAELTSLLTKLQQQLSAMENAPDRHTEVKSDLAGLVRAGADSPRALNQADDDVITLVSMLFDFILDDRALPSEIKALLGRLQIPLLKVALLEKEFFSEQDHPARVLLNAMAKAGVGWTPETDDGLKEKIESVVHTVLNDFQDDVGLFARLLGDFSAFQGEREKRMQLIEQRLADREEGQAKTEVAQKLVRDAIATRIAGRKLPPETVSMIRDGWQRVLYMTAIREGADSGDWKQRLKVLEVLVWCSQPQPTEEARARQRGLVPRLLVSMRKGFEAVGYDAAQGDAMIAATEKVLVGLGGGAETKTVNVVAEPAPPPPKESRAAAQTDALQVVRASDEEVVIAASPPEPPPPPPTDERWKHMVDSIAPGAWIEFSEQDFKVRAKVAARIRALDKIIFVNSRGVKIAEKSSAQLAQDFATGVAIPVADNALFDRALETMIGRLKAGEAVPR